MSLTDNGLSVTANQTGLLHVSTALLKAELASRQDEADTLRPECGSAAGTGSYNTPLHVAAVFLILALSVLACSFPIVVRRFPRLPVPHRFLFLSRHFGTGVLIATAFVHLLPTAFVSLTDACLPPFWNEGYPAMAGLIAMTSVLVVVAIEMFFAIRGAGHSHDYGMLDQDEEANRLLNSYSISNGDIRPGPRRKSSSINRFRPVGIGLFEPDKEHLANGGGASLDRLDTHGRSLSISSRHSISSYKKVEDDDDGDSDHIPDKPNDLQDPLNPADNPQDPNRSTDQFIQNFPSQPENPLQDPIPTTTTTHPTRPTDTAEEQRELLQCFLLEAGILFHSVFIGMALSVATGTSFIVLLTAISFHQTFEGLALGSRIAAIKSFGPGSYKPWAMALAYGTTTPAGQLLGLLVHNLYDPRSETGLLMVGVTNAVSSGLLLYAGLVELLAEDFLSEKSYETLRGGKRLQACAAVVAGSILMALVGAWA